MIIKENVPLSKISRLSTLNGGGYIKRLYEPENLRELEKICLDFYINNQQYDLIGHTSNTLYMPDYCCERMVSTRKLNRYEFVEDGIYCECGVSVKKLSIAAVERGIKGFEGLVDLPGTVASAIYGNAGCYDCLLSSLLKEATVLTSDGSTKIVKPDWFEFAHRSSKLKRHAEKAIILSVTLRKEVGNVDTIKAAADRIHAHRQQTQPDPKNSLGSIFSYSGRPTMLYYTMALSFRIYVQVKKIFGINTNDVSKEKIRFMLYLLGARDIEPYVKTWNWYQWNDEKSFDLFWKFVGLHKQLFTHSDFEIEIKQ